MATAGTLEYLISIDSSKLNSGLSNAEGKVKNFGKGLSAGAVAIGNLMSRVAEKAVSATGRFIKSAIQESQSFDKSMAQVAATMGKTTEEVQDLANFARKMGSETAFTAEEAAQGLNYMALAGYDATKSMRMLPQVLNLAAAGNFDLAAASDMVTDAQSALGLTIEGTETLIDQMAKTASKSNTSVSQLGDAILTVGGTAKMMGEDTEMLNATLGILADNGIKGSEGGTALRNVLLSLSAPTDKAKKALKDLDVQVFDSKGNMRSMEDIMLDMSSAMEGMTSEQRTNIINTIFNKRDLKSVEALLGTTKDRWEELLGSISDSKGAADRMAKTQLANLAGDVTKFKSALGEAKLAVVEGLTPAFRTWTQAATLSLQRITKAFKKGGLKAAVTEAKDIFGKAMDALRKSTNNFISTIGKIGYLFKDGLKGVKINAAELLGIDDPKNASWGQIGGKIVAKIKGGLGKVKILAADLLDIPDPKDASWQDIAGKIIDGLKDKIKSGGDFIKGLVLGDAATSDTTWSEVAQELTTKLGSAFKEGGVLDFLLGESSEIIGAAADFASEFILGIANWINNPENAGSFQNMIKNVIGSIAKVLTDPGLWQALGKAAENIFDAIFGEGAVQKIKDLFHIGSQEEQEATTAGKTIAQQIADAAKETIDKSKLDPLGLFGLGETWDSNIRRIFQESGFTGDALEKAVSKYSFKNIQEAFENWGADAGDFFKTLEYNLSQTFGEQGIQIPFDPDYSNVESSEVPEKEGTVEELPDFSAVESSSPPTLQGVVEYSPAFGDKDYQETPFGSGKNYQRRKRNKDAKGNWYVPYDNYPTLLHRGEMVLNKSQARQLRDGESGVSSDVGGLINTAVEKAMSKVYVMLNGDKVGDLTTKRIRKNINATSYNKLRALGG